VWHTFIGRHGAMLAGAHWHIKVLNNETPTLYEQALLLGNAKFKAVNVNMSDKHNIHTSSQHELTPAREPRGSVMWGGCGHAILLSQTSGNP
jgi:hypothetical protein